IIESLDHVLSEIKDAETGARGFAITGGEKFLNPYLGAKTNAEAALRRATTLLEGTPEQLAKAQKLPSLLDAKFKDLETYIEARRDQGLEAAVAMVGRDNGRTIMEEIRQHHQDIVEFERARLTERQREEQRRAHQTESV